MLSVVYGAYIMYRYTKYYMCGNDKMGGGVEKYNFLLNILLELMKGNEIENFI